MPRTIPSVKSPRRKWSDIAEAMLLQNSLPTRRWIPSSPKTTKRRRLLGASVEGRIGVALRQGCILGSALVREPQVPPEERRNGDANFPGGLVLGDAYCVLDPTGVDRFNKLCGSPEHERSLTRSRKRLRHRSCPRHPRSHHLHLHLGRPRNHRLRDPKTSSKA